MRELLVVEPNVAIQSGFQFFARTEMMALQHVLDPAVKPLDHAVGLGRSWRSEAVFNIEGCAKRVEVMLACRGAFAQAEEPVGELLAARHWARTNGAFNGSLRQDGADPYWAGAFQIS